MKSYNKAKSKFKPKGDATLNYLIYRYKAGAKRRKLEFNLSKEDFLTLVTGNCVFCGEKPKKYSVYDVKRMPIFQETKDRSSLDVNGIDRLDPKLGYDVQNCVSCCYKCNIAKSDMTLKEFREWVLKLQKFSMEGKYL